MNASFIPPALDVPQEICAGCGYSLRGLPAAGNCPECGERYSPELPVIFGWRPASHWPFTRGCMVAAAIWIGLTSVMMALTRQMPIAAVLYGVAAITIGFWPWFKKRFLFLTRRSVIQLRLSREGYGSRKGFGAVEMLSWSVDFEIDLFPEGANIHRLRIARLSPVGSIDWSTVVTLGFSATPSTAGAIRLYMDDCRMRHKGENR